jgi:hypothetical protein
LAIKGLRSLELEKGKQVLSVDLFFSSLLLGLARVSGRTFAFLGIELDEDEVKLECSFGRAAPSFREEEEEALFAGVK